MELLNFSIRHKTLFETISTILEQNDEDKSWSLYCAHISNFLNEGISYIEFKKQYLTPRPKQQEEKKMSKKEVQVQVLKAETMLKGFAPPVKEVTADGS